MTTPCKNFDVITARSMACMYVLAKLSCLNKMATLLKAQVLHVKRIPSLDNAARKTDERIF